MNSSLRHYGKRMSAVREKPEKLLLRRHPGKRRRSERQRMVAIENEM